jgi:hypothetical protein
MGWCGLFLSGSGYEPVEGSCYHCNEPTGSVTAATREGLSSLELVIHYYSFTDWTL